jgi:hypothetical protein
MPISGRVHALDKSAPAALDLRCTLPRDLRRVKVQVEATTSHKRIEITVQTDQILIIRRRSSVRCWCPECAANVEAVNLAQAEAFAGRAQPRLGDDAGANKRWHRLEGPDGTSLVCAESLLKSM